jgi:hypothetical protein
MSFNDLYQTMILAHGLNVFYNVEIEIIRYYRDN